MRELDIQKYREYIYLSLIAILLFALNTFDKGDRQLYWYNLNLLLIYFPAAIFINYYLIRKYFNKKRPSIFLFYVLLTVVAAVSLDELMFEKLFLPDTRGRDIRFLRSLLDGIPILSLLVGFKFVWDSYLTQQRMDALSKLALENQLENLKAQINPHFLFNNLNTIYSYALEHSTKTPEIILQLSSILRYMLYDCSEARVSLTKEIENLENYTQLCEAQMEGRGMVKFHASTVQGDIMIAPLIFIIFIENAFKYVLATQSSQIRLNVIIDIQEDFLHFYCENSFSPYDKNEMKFQGIGLENVKQRLELLYPKKHVLNIDSYSSMYSVSLKLDLKE